MGLNWRGTQRFTGTLDASSAIKIGFGDGYALAGGETYFVDMSSGSDGRRGRNPKDPLKTITAAMDKCVANRGDAIVVMAASPSSPASEETFPIAMDTGGVLLAGLYSRGLLSDSGFGTDVLNGNTIEVSANYCTIENLYLGVKTGGSTANVIAGTASSYGFTLRNCLIENQYTALAGFYTGSAYDFPYLLIEDNKFGGSAATANFTNAIKLFNATFGVIRRNLITASDGYAISILATCGEVMILDNRIQCYADTDGYAIYAASGSSNNYITGNECAHGYNDTSNDPYWDANGDDSNDWGRNYVGDDIEYPSNS